jgi:tetratricopeptide (TPR) repeat protein
MKRLLAAVVMAGLLLVTSAALGAQVEDLIATWRLEAKDDARLAARILTAAKATDQNRDLQIRLYEKAYQYGAKTPAGCATAIEAVRLLAAAAPTREAECQDNAVDAAQRAYRAARGPARQEAGTILVEQLAWVADAREHGGEFREATNLLTRALAVAKAVRSDQAGRLPARLKCVRLRLAVEQQIGRAKARLESDPADAEAAKELVALCVTELDNPAEAAKFADATGDEPLKKRVLVAGMSLDNLPEKACLELGNWYVQLTEGATDYGSFLAYENARDYYLRFLELHPGQDVDGLKVSASLARVEKTLKELTARLGLEQAAPWKRAFAFKSPVGLLRTTGRPDMREPYAARTVEMWVQPGKNDGMIFDEGGNANGQALAISKSRIRYAVCIEGDKVCLETPLPKTAKWVHVALQFEKGEISLWVNGQPKATSRTTLPEVKQHTQTATLGAGSDNDAGHWSHNHPGFAGKVAVFKVSAGTRYTKPFEPRKRLRPGTDTLYFLSAERLPDGAVASAGIKDQARHDSETTWVPQGQVEVVKL